MFVRWTHSVVFIKRSRRFAILIGIDHKTQRVRWLLADVIHLWSHRNDCPGPNKHWHTLKGSFYANHRECANVCRSEEHTSELQSRQYLVCRLLLEKKKKKKTPDVHNGNTRGIGI